MTATRRSTKKFALARELETYLRHKDELLARAAGWFVLIRHEEVIGVFASRPDALAAGYERFGNTPFLVHQVTEHEEPMTFTDIDVRA